MGEVLMWTLNPRSLSPVALPLSVALLGALSVARWVLFAWLFFVLQNSLFSFLFKKSVETSFDGPGHRLAQCHRFVLLFLEHVWIIIDGVLRGRKANVYSSHHSQLLSIIRIIKAVIASKPISPIPTSVHRRKATVPCFRPSAIC